MVRFQTSPPNPNPQPSQPQTLWTFPNACQSGVQDAQDPGGELLGGLQTSVQVKPIQCIGVGFLGLGLRLKGTRRKPNRNPFWGGQEFEKSGEPPTVLHFRSKRTNQERFVSGRKRGEAPKASLGGLPRFACPRIRRLGIPAQEPFCRSWRFQSWEAEVC